MKAFCISDRPYYRWFFSIRTIFLVVIGFFISGILDVFVTNTEVGGEVIRFSSSIYPIKNSMPQQLPVFVLVITASGILMTIVTSIRIFFFGQVKSDIERDFAKKTALVYPVVFFLCALSLILIPLNFYKKGFVINYEIYKIFIIWGWVLVNHFLIGASVSIVSLLRRGDHD